MNVQHYSSCSSADQGQAVNSCLICGLPGQTLVAAVCAESAHAEQRHFLQGPCGSGWHTACWHWTYLSRLPLVPPTVRPLPIPGISCLLQRESLHASSCAAVCSASAQPICDIFVFCLPYSSLATCVRPPVDYVWEGTKRSACALQRQSASVWTSSSRSSCNSSWSGTIAVKLSHFACRFGRSPMVSNMVTTWQERLLDCVGLPKDVIAPADTINVAVVDRPYSAGRAFLNLPDLVGTLEVSLTWLISTQCIMSATAGRFSAAKQLSHCWLHVSP